MNKLCEICENECKQNVTELVSCANYKLNWYKTVYKLSEDIDLPKEWKDIRGAVIKRDKRCVSCGKKKRLTVHHLKHREDGGSNDMSNLVTLCVKCHDRVELSGDRYIFEIKGSGKRKYIPKGERVLGGATHWHQWVYGGYKKP